jgi:hypothetical protein
MGLCGKPNEHPRCNIKTVKGTMMRKTIIVFAVVMASLITVQFFRSPAYGAWNPIIGIPEPPFGITQTAPAVPNPWTSETAGFYFVNYLTGTDSGRTYGTPANPRKTIPATIPAGSVVTISGTTYDQQNLRVMINGTSTSPVYIRSVDYASRTKITAWTIFDGSYGILENLHFGPANSTDGDFGVAIYEDFNPHHLTFRNVEFSGNNQKAGGFGAGAWGYTGANTVSYIVLDNVYIHNIGQIQINVDTDAHGITLNGSVNNFWVVNSTIHNCAGDGMQIEAQQGRRNKIHHIYFGKNNSYANKQTAFWIKHATDVIVSQNKLHNSYSVDAYSGGTATGWQYGPEYVWFLANEIYDAETGFGVGSGDPPGDGLYQFIIGNVIHGIHSSSPTNSSNSGAMMLRGGANIAIINNTIYGQDAGINIPTDGIIADIQNNIFAGRAEVTGNEILTEASGASLTNSLVKNNLFYNTGNVRINWGGNQYNSLAAFQSGTGKGQACLSTNPLFISPSDNNFALQSTSPALDAGVAHASYTTFYNRYGIDIAKDFNLINRPQGSVWDIGAFEGGGSGGTPRQPNAPTNLFVR